MKLNLQEKEGAVKDLVRKYVLFVVVVVVVIVVVFVVIVVETL